MYWKAHIDANDVEFVLSPQTNGKEESSEESSRQAIMSTSLGKHCVWILDFDCCRNMPCDEDGVEQAVAAFFRNDPYYPRPGREGNDRLLWEEFKKQFLTTSENVLGHDSEEARLPTLWVHLAEQRGLSKMTQI